MAVPDRRATFDFFRPHTVAGDWLAAYLDDRARPTFQQSFDAAATDAGPKSSRRSERAAIMRSKRPRHTTSGS